MCVSINGPGDLVLSPSDLETGVRVASKVGNLPSEFGHARPLGSRVIRYVRDGQTDRQTDGRTEIKSHAYCPLTYGRGHENQSELISKLTNDDILPDILYIVKFVTSS